MIKPKALKRKKTIGIVAPAGSFSKASFLQGVEKIKSWGFRVKYSPEIFQRHGSFAGPDRLRAKQLNQMFKDPKVKAIFCAKAEYGTARIIEYLDAKAIRKNPKIVVGYSDITVLLTYLNIVHSLVVFHGPVVSGEIYEGMPEEVEKRLLAMIMGKTASLVLERDFSVLRKGKAEGIMVGGNLSRLINTLGTPFEIDTEEKILLLEDIDVSLEDIDEKLIHLKSAGKFSAVAGIIFGQLADYSGRKINKKSLAQLLDEVLKDVHVPVICDVRSGHGQVNMTMPLGAKVAIDTAKRTLRLKEKPVCL